MVNSPVCEQCGRPSWVLSRCECCGKSVCLNCLTPAALGKQLCRRCERLDPGALAKPVLALSGYAEWFWTMALNIKPVENRGWSLFKYIKYSQLPIRVYLHASKTVTSKREMDFIRSNLNLKQRQEFAKVDWGKYRGHIIGEITITGQVTANEIGMKAVRSPWFFGPFGFECRDGVLYDKPIPYSGSLGFFKVKMEVGE